MLLRILLLLVACLSVRIAAMHVVFVWSSAPDHASTITPAATTAAFTVAGDAQRRNKPKPNHEQRPMQQVETSGSCPSDSSVNVHL